MTIYPTLTLISAKFAVYKSKAAKHNEHSSREEKLAGVGYILIGNSSGYIL